MRFRKSIRISKGVKLNLSKTGASFTLGGGAPVSLNVGTKGAFLNWSIPGTGVYDRVRLDTALKKTLGGLLGGKDAAQEEGRARKERARRSAPDRPSDEELDAVMQEMALIDIHEQAIDVRPEARGAIDAARTEAALDEWLSDCEAPIAFAVDAQVIEEKDAVMIDLDLPEIEDMPDRKLTELADGTVKIKKKTKKEQAEDYRICAFGLGEYVASHVFALAPQAKRVVVSAYTQRRSEKTGELMDVFIYSVMFERRAFVPGYQEMNPCEFCETLPSRFYVLASGQMKAIVPFEAEDIA